MRRAWIGKEQYEMQGVLGRGSRRGSDPEARPRKTVIK